MTTVVLQPGGGPVHGLHHLPTRPDTALWGLLPDASTEAVIAVADGDTVTVDTLSHEGVLDEQGRDPVAFFGGYGVDRAAVLDDAVALAASGIDSTRGGPHVVTGPIAVAGARPGDVLKVDVLQLALRTPYGIVSNRHGFGALPGEMPETEGPVMVFAGVEQHGGGLYGTMPFAGDRRVHFPLAPFMGIMGVAPAIEGPVSSTPPGAHGGNIDVNLLNVGSTLYLPVQVEGAHFYTGDPHYAQGDGEVALTAMEASIRGTFRLSVLRGDEAAAVVGALDRPMVETADAWVPMGLDVDLDEAMCKAVRAAIAFLAETQGMERHVAYAYLSAAADFEVSQVVDSVKGVHCVIRKADFRPWV